MVLRGPSISNQGLSEKGIVSSVAAGNAPHQGYASVYGISIQRGVTGRGSCTIRALVDAERNERLAYDPGVFLMITPTGTLSRSTLGAKDSMPT